jgi:hypothetical protein
MDWNDPEQRLALLESVGLDEYNRRLNEFHNRAVVQVVNGHGIRPVHTRFGLLYMVGDTGRAFSTPDDAVKYAEGH